MTDLYPPSLYAAQTGARVNVSVALYDNISVSDATQGIQLNLTGGPGTEMLSGPSDGTARLNYLHNSPVSKKITAQVTPAGMPSGSQDITLKVAVSGGTEQTVVQDGTAQGPKVVLGNIAPGVAQDAQVSYSASATASETQPGNYAFRVTFTSLDDN